MNLKKLASCVVSSLFFISCAHHSAKVTPAPAPQASAANFNMSPEEMEQAFQKANKTGAEHAALKDLVGTWNAQVKWWMDPSGKPQISKGKSVNRAILGGKFIREDYSGSMMGRPFEGVGYLGYDNVAQNYTSYWIDSMSTASMIGTGTYDSKARAWAFNNEMSCPILNDKIKMRSVSRVVDKNHFVFEMFGPGPDGKEYKNLEITYSKQKAAKK